LAHLALHDHGVLARAYEITHGLIACIRDVNRLEFSSPRKARQFHRIAPVGLDAVGGDTTMHSSPCARSLR
jgi:hypothetical protein